ncbi:MAG TPA: sigma-70 family RNA polymerase sigma factor [Polyangiales bacterium]|nr:sigma-70 family RNA polymerase sigma factor [Polyangiales bacterium]
MDAELNQPPSHASELTRALDAHRVELTGYCYRMLGSAFEAEDAVQETWLRAWRGHDAFEGRASLRSWLYRIATNVCLNMRSAPQRRARPMDLGPAWTPGNAIGVPLEAATWLEPMPDARVVPATTDPMTRALARETVRLAFLAALQRLPPKQRAVLILRDVLSWSAEEVAELLDSSVPSINSALQRARATLASARAPEPRPSDEAAERELLDRFVDAFERFDVEGIVSLLRDDATQCMPPYALWLDGPDAIRNWWLGPGAGCRGSQLRVVAANGCPAVAQWKPSGPGDSLLPFAIHVLEVVDGRIASLHSFLDVARLFPLFDLR